MATFINRPAMSNFLRIAFGLMLALLVACATPGTPPSGASPPAGLTFVVVRHAEKALEPAGDPMLTAAGRARAEALATALTDAPMVAVYATGYLRTQQTAAPTARMHHLPVTTYDAKQPAKAFVAQLRKAHRSGQVLVVGHSNTVPDIAAALCGCAVAAMDESEYDRRMTVNITADGSVALIVASVP